MDNFKYLVLGMLLGAVAQTVIFAMDRRLRRWLDLDNTTDKSEDEHDR